MSVVFRALCAGLLAVLLAGASFQAHAQTEGPAPAPAPSGHGPAHLFSPSTQEPAPDPSEPVGAASAAAQTAMGQCSQGDRTCIADALDAYAAALRSLSPPLPADLQGLPDVVSRAARSVRQAKTRAQAVKAIKAAVAVVRKTIALLKADDPVVLAAETRDGGFVAETLEVAQNKLEKAVGL